MDRPDSSKMTRLDKQFSDRKEEIRQVYCKEGKPLRETMDFFAQQSGLKASMRKWKSKLKDWGFEKYLKAEGMAFIASKLQSRKADGKDTAFLAGDRQITKEAIENFSKRKRVDAEKIGSPTTETPANVSYFTPEPEESKPEESEDDKILKMIADEVIIDFARKKEEAGAEKIRLPTIRTPAGSDYFVLEVEKSEVEEMVRKIAEEMARRKKKEQIIEILKKAEAKDNCTLIFVQDDISTAPLLLKVDGKIKWLDAIEEDEPDQETMDMLAKVGHSSWKEFRKLMLFSIGISQDTGKAPLFPKPPGEVSHSATETKIEDLPESSTLFYTSDTTRLSGGNPLIYAYEESKDDENTGESVADPLHQGHRADDAQKPKHHSFFRFDLGDGKVFQIVPESEAQLLPPEDVRSFLGLKDRNLDVAEQVMSAVGILDSTGPEQDDAQHDHSSRLDDLARDLETMGGENKTAEQEIWDYDKEGQEIEDVSSNPFGVTYTESCTTGISWDYSALFP